MKNWFSKMLEEMTEQGRNAFRVNLITLGAVFVSLPLYAYLAVQSGVWQIYAILATVVAFLVLLVYSAVLIRQNRVNVAMSLIVGGVCVIIPEITALISGLGVLLALTLVLLPILVGHTLSKAHAARAVIVGVVFGILTLLIELFAPWQRIAYPLLNTAIPYIAAPALLILGVYFVRQFRNFSLRTKLLTGITALIVLSLGIVSGTNYYYSRANLIDAAGTSLKSIANAQAAAISDTLLQEANIIESFSLSKIVQDRIDEVNASYGSNIDSNLQKIKELDQQWLAADAANNNNDPLVSTVLISEQASELREFSETFPGHAEVFVTDRYGALVAATNRTSDYYQADEEWWQAAFNEGRGAIYFGQPEFDQSSQTFGIIMALPILSHGSNEVAGVIRTTLRIEAVLTILNTDILNGTGEADLYLPNSQVLDPEFEQGLTAGDPEALSHLEALLGKTTYASFSYEDNPGIVSVAPVTSAHPEAQSAIQDLGWVVVIHQDAAASLAPILEQTRSTVLIALVVLTLGALGAVLLSQVLTSPIERLTQTAQKITAGDITVQAEVEAKDEIGTLAGAFNTMTSQLRESIGSLEHRVSDRTQELEAAQAVMFKRAVELQSVAEIATKASQSTNIYDMLQTVVDLTKQSYSLYHAHIYLLDEKNEKVVLAAGAGSAGRQMVGEKRSIPIDHPHSLVARAARTGQSAIANDIAKETDFLPNPLLPATKAEMAIPISMGDTVLGVLDVQADLINRFTDEDVAIKTTLAQQVATSLQNIRNFTRAQRQAERESTLNQIGQQIQSADSVEAVLQITARELGRALRSKDTRVIVKDLGLAVQTEK